MKFGYARVSTTKQDLHDQLKQLNDLGIETSNIYAEKLSGKNTFRPELRKLLNSVRKGDEVVVIKLDRLSRSVKDGIEIIEQLNAKGVDVTVKGLGTFTNDDNPMQSLMRNMLLSFAEFERTMIIDRMASGKQYAKATNPNYREGRPKKVLGKRELNILEYRQTHSLKETSQMFGISVATIKRWQNLAKE